VLAKVQQQTKQKKKYQKNPTTQFNSVQKIQGSGTLANTSLEDFECVFEEMDL
jgi:hypothetical protein